MKTNKKVSIKEIYFWNLMGSLCNALTSMILLFMVTRTTTDQNCDIFSIGFAISQQLVTIGIFQVRNFQATDVTEKFKFNDYFQLRVITCFIMVISAAGYVILKGYALDKAIVVVLLVLYKVIEAMSDVFQGLFQQKERLDLAGKALVIRSIVSSIAFGITIALTSNLILAVLVLFGSSFISFILYDYKKHKLFDTLSVKRDIMKPDLHTCLRIAVQCLPLFVNGFLIMAIYNAPKNAIDEFTMSGVLTSGIQTDFSVLFMPASVINLFLIFLRPFMTSMAYAFTQMQWKRFYKMVSQMVLGIIAFGIMTVVGAYLLGIPVLELLSSRDLEKYKMELIILIVAGGVSSLATVFDNIITVIRMQHLLVIGYILSYVIAKVTANILIPSYGMKGAGFTFLLSVTFLCLSNAIFLGIGIKRKRGKKSEQ